MARLKAAILAGLLVWAAPATGAPLARWSAHIAEASARFGIPEEWIRRVMRAESGGRTLLRGRPIVSRAGAMGLMQLMPGTWREISGRLGLGADPHDPRDNILAGAFYLRMMYDRLGYPGLFGAYNAGPARYAEHLATGRRLPRETVAYLAGVAGTTALAAARREPAATLFAVQTGPRFSGDEVVRASALTPQPGLFVALRTVPGR